PNAAFTVADCPPPDTAAIAAGAPAVFVSANDADPLTPAVVAVTGNDPATVFAATATPARPAASVTAVEPPGKLTPAPLAGPANVTLTPGTGLPNGSVTFATSRLTNPVVTVVDWPVPESAATAAAAPAVLVRLNSAWP